MEDKYFHLKFFGLGSLINLFLEILFLRFNLGINNYLILNKKSLNDTSCSKTIIIPAKNEELNLIPLLKEFLDFNQNMK